MRSNHEEFQNKVFLRLTQFRNKCKLKQKYTVQFGLIPGHSKITISKKVEMAF